MLPFYHPSTTLFVDDDSLFLDSCTFRYGRKFRCTSAKSPAGAIELMRASDTKWIERLRRIMPKSTITQDDTVSAGTSLVAIESGGLVKLASDAERHQTISVVVVDYAMPSMSGLQLFQEIQSLPIGKILLTGKAGADVAIDAFNAGLIDQFILKQDPDVSGAIIREVERLQRKFFRSAATQILPDYHGSLHGFMQDQAMQAYIEMTAKSFASVEHFFSGDPLGVFFLDAQGAKSCVLVADADQLQAQWEVAGFLGAPDDLLEQLEKCTVVPMFNTSTGFYDPSLQHDWQDHLYPASRIDGATGKWWVAPTRSWFQRP